MARYQAMGKKDKKNGTKPATQHDVSLLAGEMSLHFREVDARFMAIENRLDKIEVELVSLHRGQEAILNVLTSIDIQLRELKTIPTRVARLERSRR